MKFRKFEFIILVQLVLIAISNFLIAWSILQEHLKVSVIYFSIVLAIQVVYLFYYIRKNNSEIYQFLSSLKYGDEFTRLNITKSERSHRRLRVLLNEIAESYSRVKIEKENEHFYFLNTIKHVNVGLISYDENGKIELMNAAAERLINIHSPKNIKTINEVFEKSGFSIYDLIPNKPKLVKFKRDNEILQLSFNLATFIIKDHKITLVSLQDIRNEIQQEEIEIWQKLIRVLTHEIMNSAGPITSLSSTISDTFKDDIKPHKIGETLYDQIVIGLQAIQKRSRGLAKFVETYRNLTKLPKPVFSQVLVSEFLSHLQVLVQNDLDKENISFYCKAFPEDLSMTIDEKMMTQVFLNLIQNSIVALQGRNHKTINITIEKDKGQSILLIIEDNGAGIPNELLERVFVPFFTTREDGSGIGLSLSRQIVSLHGGSINIKSREAHPDKLVGQGEGTKVEIRI